MTTEINNGIIKALAVPPVPSADDREAFEAWAEDSNRGFSLDCNFFQDGNNYESFDTRLAFEIWQASSAKRDALIETLRESMRMDGETMAAKDARIAELEKSCTEWIEAYWKTQQPTADLEVVGYLRADLAGKPEWSEDCVCEQAIYPNYDGDNSVSMPICRLSDALAVITQQLLEAKQAHFNEVGQLRAQLKAQQPNAIHIVLDGPPGPEAGRFVEAEDSTGKSINAGLWNRRADGYWELVIQRPAAGVVLPELEQIKLPEHINTIAIDELRVFIPDDYFSFDAAEAIQAYADIHARKAVLLALSSLNASAVAVQVQVQICKLGLYGKAYDAPGDCRAYTYADQPDNGGAWQLGGAVADAHQNGGGDYIDYGLGLLKSLQERGFGVFEIAAPSAQQKESGDE